jgi:hypothetical protein
MHGFRQFFARYIACWLSPWSACTWGHDPGISVFFQVRGDSVNEFQIGSERSVQLLNQRVIFGVRTSRALNWRGYVKETGALSSTLAYD